MVDNRQTGLPIDAGPRGQGACPPELPECYASRSRTESAARASRESLASRLINTVKTRSLMPPPTNTASIRPPGPLPPDDPCASKPPNSSTRPWAQVASHRRASVYRRHTATPADRNQSGRTGKLCPGAGVVTRQMPARTHCAIRAPLAMLDAPRDKTPVRGFQELLAAARPVSSRRGMSSTKLQGPKR